MQLNKQRAYDPGSRLAWLIHVELALCALIIWYTFAGEEAMVSNLFAVSFLMLLILLVANPPLFADELFVLACLIVLLSFVSVMISWGVNTNAKLSFEAIKPYMIFCCTILFSYILLEIRLPQKSIKSLLYLSVLIAFLFPLGRFWFGFSKMDGELFYMNFSNPNLTGMFLLQASMCSTIGIVLLKTPFWKIMCAVALLLNIQMMEWTKARNSLIALTAFFFIGLWSFLKTKTKLPKWLLALTAIFPLLFVPLYLGTIELIESRGMFSSLVSEGKSLHSRVRIWEALLGEVKGHVLTGDYFQLAGNAHNSHVVVLCSFGLIVLCLVIRFLFVVMNRVNGQCRTSKQLLCLAAFFGTIYMGLGEGALFSGSMGLYIVACIPLLLARIDWTTYSMNNMGQGR